MKRCSEIAIYSIRPQFMVTLETQPAHDRGTLIQSPKAREPLGPEAPRCALDHQ